MKFDPERFIGRIAGGGEALISRDQRLGPWIDGIGSGPRAEGAHNNNRIQAELVGRHNQIVVRAVGGLQFKRSNIHGRPDEPEEAGIGGVGAALVEERIGGGKGHRSAIEGRTEAGEGVRPRRSAVGFERSRRLWFRLR